MELHFHVRRLIICLFLCSYPFAQTAGKSGLCEVETGQSSSSIIVDIKESRGNETNQVTSPAELPIIGDPYTEIILNLVFPKGEPIFTLEGKRLKLVAPLDRDSENRPHIPFQLTCAVRGTASLRKRSIPIIVRISDINDNAPQFVGTPYETTISELTPIGTTVFKDLKATDADAGVNGLVEYFIVAADSAGISNAIDRDNGWLVNGPSAANNKSRRLVTADGFSIFTINLPHQGHVTLNRSLDYEKVQRYLLTIVASYIIKMKDVYNILTNNQFDSCSENTLTPCITLLANFRAFTIPSSLLLLFIIITTRL